MVAVAPTVSKIGPLLVATWAGLDGGDTGDAVDVRGYNRIVLVSAGTFADSDNVDVEGAAATLAGAVGTAGAWHDWYDNAINIVAAEEVHVLNPQNTEWLSLTVNAGGVAGPSAIDIVAVALRTQDY